MNYKQRQAILNSYKKKWLAQNHTLNDGVGIYILTRTDENGVRYSYIGQSVNILTRLAQHLMGYQHIDLSLKTHKLYDMVLNPCGWSVDFINCTPSELNELEQKYIMDYIKLGYQSRNKTTGSQDKAKSNLDNQESVNGYYKGVEQGKRKTRRYVREMFDKYLTYTIKKENKICERKLVEFETFLHDDEQGE